MVGPDFCSPDLESALPFPNRLGTMKIVLQSVRGHLKMNIAHLHYRDDVSALVSEASFESEV